MLISISIVTHSSLPALGEGQEGCSEFTLSGKSLNESEKSGVIHKTFWAAASDTQAWSASRACLFWTNFPAPTMILKVCVHRGNF